MDNFEKSKSHWYVLQVMSGQENRAMKAIQTQRELDAREGIDDGVDDIRIPIDKVQVAQTNAKGVRKVVTKERKRYPGYVLIQARLYTEEGGRLPILDYAVSSRRSSPLRRWPARWLWNVRRC